MQPLPPHSRSNSAVASQATLPATRARRPPSASRLPPSASRLPAKVSDTSSLSDMTLLTPSQLLATLLLVAAASAPPAAAQSARTGTGGAPRDALPVAVPVPAAVPAPTQQPARRVTPPAQPRVSQTPPAVTRQPLLPTFSPAPRVADPVVPVVREVPAAVGRTVEEPDSSGRIPEEPAFLVASRYTEVPTAVARAATDPVPAAQAGAYCRPFSHFLAQLEPLCHSNRKKAVQVGCPSLESLELHSTCHIFRVPPVRWPICSHSTLRGTL